MNDYYINYLKSSKCFINLTVSLKQMEEIKASISVFKDIFNSNVSGNVIDEFKDRIDALDKKVDIYISRIKAIIEKLQENAKKGDSVLSSWKEKASSELVLNKNETGPSIVGTRNKTVHGNFYTVSVIRVVRTTVKVSSANIGSNGYIEVHTKTNKETYEYESGKGLLNMSQARNSGLAISLIGNQATENVIYYDFSGAEVSIS